MLFLLCATFLWGTSFIAGKIAYQVADPSLVVLLRLLIASSVFLPVSVRFFRRLDVYQSLNRQDWLWLIFLGLLTYPVTFLPQFIGLSLTSASSAATVMGVEPIMVSLVGYWVFRDKPSAWVLLLGVMAFVGVAMMVGLSSSTQINALGCFLVFLSTLAVAFWLRLSQKLIQKMQPLYYTAFSLQFGLLFGLPLMTFFVQDWSIQYSSEGILAIFYLAVACSLLASWLWNQGLKIVDANISGIFLALEPVFGVLFAVWLLNDALDWVALLGASLVIVAAALSVLLPKST